MPPLDNTAHENPIPAAVRRASKRADDIAREMGATNVPEETPAEPLVEEPPVETAVEEPPAPAEPPAEPPVEPPVVDWEHRHRTLQGKYDREIPDLRAQVASLQQLVASMEHQPARPEPPASATTVVEIPQAEIEAYGEDLVGAARRWARAEMQSELDGLRGELRELRGGQQQLSTKTTQQQLIAALDGNPPVPDWRAINEMPEFIQWLNQVDPFSGQVRMGLLQNAFAQGDANRCGHFFKSFVAEHTATGQRSTSPTPQTPAPPEAERPTLESMAAPGRAAGSGPTSGAPAEKRVWTRSEITAFYRDCSAGKYASSEQVRARIEADIFAAQSEGRIR